METGAPGVGGQGTPVQERNSWKFGAHPSIGPISDTKTMTRNWGGGGFAQETLATLRCRPSLYSPATASPGAGVPKHTGSRPDSTTALRARGQTTPCCPSQWPRPRPLTSASPRPIAAATYPGEAISVQSGAGHAAAMFLRGGSGGAGRPRELPVARHRVRGVCRGARGALA